MIAQPREAVWDRIVDFGGLASWRRDVERVERLPDRDGHEVWREGNLALETMALERPSRLVRRIAEPGAWGGDWEIVLREEGAGCRVTVMESGLGGEPAAADNQPLRNRADAVDRRVSAVAGEEFWGGGGPGALSRGW